MDAFYSATPKKLETEHGLIASGTTSWILAAGLKWTRVVPEIVAAYDRYGEHQKNTELKSLQPITGITTDVI